MEFFYTNLQRQLLQRKKRLTLRRDTFFFLHLGPLTTYLPKPVPRDAHTLSAPTGRAGLSPWREASTLGQHVSSPGSSTVLKTRVRMSLCRPTGRNLPETRGGREGGFPEHGGLALSSSRLSGVAGMPAAWVQTPTASSLQEACASIREQGPPWRANAPSGTDRGPCTCRGGLMSPLQRATGARASS